MPPFSRIKCDASCNGSDRTYESLNLRSQSVLKRSEANCDRGFISQCNLQTKQTNIAMLYNLGMVHIIMTVDTNH